MADHIARFGLVCEGYEVPEHPVDSPSDLTLDHALPVALGGGDDPVPGAVLCRGCNARKGARP